MTVCTYFDGGNNRIAGRGVSISIRDKRAVVERVMLLAVFGLGGVGSERFSAGGLTRDVGILEGTDNMGMGRFYGSVRVARHDCCDTLGDGLAV